MDILVCIKQVPGTSDAKVDPVTGVLQRDGVPAKLNPYDLYALEMAMQLRERYGGSVKVITMGPRQAEAAVREAEYMGVDDGAVISDRRFAGADVLATSYTISQGIKKLGSFDLILCGKQTTDGDTAQVGAELGEFLGIPHVGNVTGIEDISEGKATVRVNLDKSFVRYRLPLPCLICADGDINTPRLPSYKRKCSLSGEQVAVITLDDLDDRNEKHYGLTGSPTQVERIFPPEKNTKKMMLRGTDGELADKLYALLSQRKFI